jgi:hypothetical protein
MNLAKQIQNLKFEFEMQTGEKANALYVGEIEWVYLVRQALAKGIKIDSKFLSSPRLVCNGLSVFRVDVYQHLYVGKTK